MRNADFGFKAHCFLAFVVGGILITLPAMSQIYTNDFEGPVGTEWSNTLRDTAPNGSRTFLGQFGNDTVTLTIPSVPISMVTVSFELFIIHSWDGHGDEDDATGPDIWDLSVAGGPTLLHTTFATHNPRLQAYPGTYVARLQPPLNPPQTGAAEINSLGFEDFFGTGDVYYLSFTFAHGGGPLSLDFSAFNLQDLGDESWGLDNVQLDALIPVEIDIKPGSCPNPFNVTNEGTLPVAILGSKAFNVFTIDPVTVRLEGVLPTRSSYEDVAGPVPNPEDDCACTTAGADGYIDLSLKFDIQDVVGALGPLSDGDWKPLILVAEDIDGASLAGTDCVLIIDNTKPLITSVVRYGVTDGQPITVAGPGPRGLQDGAHAYMDRPLNELDTRNYHWEDVPRKLVGADYVMTYNEDKQPGYAPKVYDVSYTVTLDQDAKLYVFMDQRYAPFLWLTDGSAGTNFTDTNLDITLNEVGGEEVLRPFDIYVAEVSAGTYILGPSCDGIGSRNFYSIAATKL